jgi:esterase FrsA
MKTLKTSHLSFLCKEPASAAKKTVFFFSLSDQDSLSLPPFCHPVDTLLAEGARVISTTLPGHENNARPYNIQEIWQNDLLGLSSFITSLSLGIKELKHQFSPPFGVMGISRGAFIALHMCSILDEVTTAVCFAPMLSVGNSEALSLKNQLSTLANKRIHFFIGDNDLIVGTENVVSMQHSLRTNSEILISPSIGRGGHGTSDEIFHKGALWMIANL